MLDDGYNVNTSIRNKDHKQISKSKKFKVFFGVDWGSGDLP